MLRRLITSGQIQLWLSIHAIKGHNDKCNINDFMFIILSQIVPLNLNCKENFFIELYELTPYIYKYVTSIILFIPIYYIGMNRMMLVTYLYFGLVTLTVGIESFYKGTS